jgi:acyl-coenzyme A thioesterase PaaI-like protein
MVPRLPRVRAYLPQFSHSQLVPGNNTIRIPSVRMTMADDITHFRSIPWVSDLLNDPTFVTHPIPSRKIKASTEDSLFSTTLNSRSTISSCLLQYRISPANATPLYRNAIPTNEVRIFCTLGSDLNGYPGILHGGIVATLLDEFMGLILSMSRAGGEPGMEGPVTAYLNTRFVRPVMTPGTVVVSGRIVEAKEERKWKIVGNIKGEDGKVLAEAECLYILPRGAGKSRL